jgi:cyclase
MLKKRIIPCLDIKEGRTVKGVNFIDLTDAGDPVELAKRYVSEGADELVFLDITATNEKRKTFVSLVEKIAAEINLPFTVGGGITSVSDVSALIKAGADKVSINTSAFNDPHLITSVAQRFGSQCVVVAIDTKLVGNDWMVYLNGGRIPTTVRTLDWAIEAERSGAGEILLTSMNNDGTKDGFAIDITRDVTEALKIPVIASGGAGNMQHFRDVFLQTGCSAALAASVFHFDEIPVPVLKQYLLKENIPIR